MLASATLAENTPQVSLETSETLFAVLTAINTCGYDQELEVSDPLRGQIRAEVAKAVQEWISASPDGKQIIRQFRASESKEPLSLVIGKPGGTVKVAVPPLAATVWL